MSRRPMPRNASATAASSGMSQRRTREFASSAATAWARAGSMLMMITAAPARVKARAVASPMPLEPPVISAIRPSNLNGCVTGSIVTDYFCYHAPNEVLWMKHAHLGLIFLFLAGSGAVLAQALAGMGGMSGVVRDPSGAVVPNANVVGGKQTQSGARAPGTK